VNDKPARLQKVTQRELAVTEGPAESVSNERALLLGVKAARRPSDKSDTG
jgi:hypothetical protein